MLHIIKSVDICDKLFKMELLAIEGYFLFELACEEVFKIIKNLLGGTLL